jgi:mucin-19
MPSLYGTGTSYTVTASNVITLYKVSTSSAVITATTYSTNLVGLYGGYWSPNPITQFVNTIVAGPGISVNTSSGNVTVSNTGVLSLRAGTNTNVSSTTGNITVWATIPNAVNTLTAGPGISVSTSSGNVVISNTGVLNLTGGTAISVSTSTGLVTVNNLGVTRLTAGTNTNISSTTGNITIWTNSFTGVTSITAGTNTNVSSTTGNITIWTNPSTNGVSSIAAGTGISVSTSTGSVTVTNIGVTNLTGTAALGVSANTGSITLTNLGVTSLTAGTAITVSNNTGSITVTNAGVTGLIAGTNTNISSTTGNVTIWSNAVANGVTSITASTGIGVSTSTGSVIITNLGVTNLTGTSALGVSASTGSITLTNLGVTSLTAGTNTNISASTGSITIWTSGGGGSSGVNSITASTGIGVSTSTGSVIITNLGVTALTGTAALGISATTGSITLTNLGVTNISAGTGITVNANTGSVTVNNAGVTSITAGTNTNVSSTTGGIVIWTNTATVFDISTWTNQRLFTTSTVQFSGINATTGTQVAQVVSAGGYPLDGNGQALIEQNGSSTPTLVVSNYTSSTRASVHVQMYGQNVPGGTSTTNASASIFLEASRGTGTAPTAIVSGDTIGALNFNAYDGSVWPGQTGSGASSGWSAASIFSTAGETFANNGTTTTNAGSRFFFRVQPSGAWANATSRQNFLLTSWTAGNTATTSAPQLNLIIGSADGTTPTLTPSSGLNSFGVGYGATNFQLINVRTSITGVVSTDAAPDNGSLPNTNFIQFNGNRGSGVSGRRQLLAANDSVGGLSFLAQTVPNGTGTGSSVGTIAMTMLEASTSTAVGTKLTISTANSGTTSVTQRLSLDNLNNLYRSDNHQFLNASGGAARLILNTTANTNNYNSDTHNFNNTAGSSTVLALTTGTSNYNNNTHNFNVAGGSTSIVQFNTSTGVALKGYSETVTTAAYTATFAPLVSTATIFKMTLTGNITFNGFTLPQAGQSAVFFFTQDATGSRTLTSSMKFAGGIKTLSAAGTSTDMMSVLYDGSIYYATLTKGYV